MAKIAKIRMRRGNAADYDETKMTSGEFAVATDTRQAFLGFGAGDAEELAFKKDIIFGGDGGTGGTNDHNSLLNRNAVNQHPIAAITGLQDALDNIFAGGTSARVVTVADAISGAENEVVYVLNEQPDGDIADILKDYQRTRDKVQVIFINTDDGVDGNISSDSTLIKTPTRNILVDIGRKSDYNTIKTTLLSAGVTRLDYIFLSHYHHDHCGCTESPTTTGAEESSLDTLYREEDIDTSKCVLVLPHTPVFADLYAGENSPVGVKKIYDIIQSVIAQNSITSQILENGHEGCYWDTEAAVSGSVPVWTAAKPKNRISVRALNCSDNKFANYYNAAYNPAITLGQYNARTYNNYGTILEVEHGYTLCTLAADINYTAEAANYPDMRQTDVFKMGHHSGDSEITEAFYEKINPRYVIFNVDHDVFVQYGSVLTAERPATAWLAARKIPMFFLSESGTMIWESDGTKYELLTNNRNQHPEGQGANLLWSGSAAPGSTIDMTGTGWKDYTLYKVLLAANGTGIIATRVTTSSGEYFRGIGGSTNGTAPMYSITAAFAATVNGDTISVFGATNEAHTTASPYHNVTANPAIIAIYGIC